MTTPHISDVRRCTALDLAPGRHSPACIQEMRDWLIDCGLDATEARTSGASWIVDIVRRNYAGGLAQFHADNLLA